MLTTGIASATHKSERWGCLCSIARYLQWRSQGGGAKGALAPPPFSRENATRVLCTVTNYSQNTNYFLLFSERSVVNIDSNDFDRAGYKADILSTYFHDDR